MGWRRVGGGVEIRRTEGRREATATPGLAPQHCLGHPDTSREEVPSRARRARQHGWRHSNEGSLGVLRRCATPGTRPCTRKRGCEVI